MNSRSACSSSAASIACARAFPAACSTSTAMARRSRRSSARHPSPAACSSRRRSLPATPFSVRDRVTVDAGVRFDHSRAINPDLPRRRRRRTRDRGHHPRDRHGLHPERRVAAPGSHGEARSPRPHDVARQLRTFQSGRVDRRARSDLTRHHADHDDGVRRGDGRLHAGWCRSSIRRATWRSIRDTRSPHTDEFSLALDREVTPRLRASAAYVRKRGIDFIGWIDTGGQYRRRRERWPTARPAGLRPDQSRVRSARSCSRIRTSCSSTTTASSSRWRSGCRSAGRRRARTRTRGRTACR